MKLKMHKLTKKPRMRIKKKMMKQERTMKKLMKLLRRKKIPMEMRRWKKTEHLEKKSIFVDKWKT